MNTEHYLEGLAIRKAALESLLAMTPAMERILRMLPDGLGNVSLRGTDDTIQVSCATREQVKSILAAVHAGEWVKKVCHADASKVDYETNIGSVRLLIFQADAPKSCRIVEEEIEVPAHKKTVRKLVCV